jgi:26S proteasome regulatory subunit N2
MVHSCCKQPVAASAGAHAVAAGVLALLDETDPAIQSFALQSLNGQVHLFWAEIAEQIPKIEVLYEDTGFPDRQLAALLASKVYYFLGELDEALNFALGADKLFQIDDLQDPYVDTVIGGRLMLR